MQRLKVALKERIKYTRVETLVMGMTAIAFLLIGALILWIAFVEAQQYALREAQNKAALLLNYSLATHRYFNEQLLPSISSTPGGGSYDPRWMSPAYAAREIAEMAHSSAGESEYQYKEAAINARDSRNEAGPLERDFLARVNQDPTVQTHTAIVHENGIPYLVTMLRGETMEESCLTCHSTPDKAPAGLVAQFGAVRSFHRQPGEVASVITVRVPLAAAYSSVWTMVGRVGLLMVVSLSGLFIIAAWVMRRMIFQPLVLVRRQAQAIVSDDRHLGQQIPLPIGNELRELTRAFNEMSVTLRNNEDRLHSKIESSTTELHRSQYMLNSILGTIPQFVGVIDCDTGKFEYINRELKRYLGETVDVILNKTIGDYHGLIHEEDRQIFYKFLQDTTSAPQNQVTTAQFRMKRASGQYCWLEFYALVFQRGPDNIPVQVLFTSQDITPQKEAEARLTYLGLHDALTGLFNRAQFTHTLDNLQDESQYPVTILMADVDNLKVENDTYGHEAGDSLLCRMARVLKGSIRSSDLVARLGGDEFAAVLVNANERVARAVQARIEKRLVEDFTSDELGRFGLSTGMVTIQRPEDLQEGLRQADEIMYQQKTAKKAMRQASELLLFQQSKITTR